MEETRLRWRVAALGGRWRDLRSQPPTANRFHLTWVGSGPRHDSAASGRDAMTSHPSGIQGGRDSDHVPTSVGTKKPREVRGSMFAC